VIGSEKREALVEMISMYKDGHALTVMEMLKVAFRPTVEQAVMRFHGTGVRDDDVRRLAETMVEKAVEAYDKPEVSPIDHVAGYLLQLDQEVERLRKVAATLRKG
jgi:hypothetical protein